VLSINKTRILKVDTMIHKILELGGVSPLTREQQKDVQGGLHYCVITTIATDGTRRRYDLVEIGSFIDREGPETQMAHNECATQLSNPAISRCFYDCSFDGWQIS
jgi:hypothetical protein